MEVRPWKMRMFSASDTVTRHGVLETCFLSRITALIFSGGCRWKSFRKVCCAS
jgi:hypothetical protein